MLKIYLLLILLLAGFAQAAQNALVIRDRAVIYADLHMKHPIGYISKWKQVRLGNVARNGGKVLPVVVSKNKIGYINIHDVSIGRDYYSVVNSYSRFNGVINQKAKKDHLTLNYSFHMGSASIDDNNFETSSVDTWFNGFGFQWNQFYNSTIGFLYGMNYEFSRAEDDVTITDIMLRVGMRYKLYRPKVKFLKGFTFNAMANAGWSPYSTIDAGIFLTEGMSTATEFGLEGYYQYTNSFDFVAFLGYEIKKVWGFDLPAGLGEFNPFITGLKFNVGLAVYF